MSKRVHRGSNRERPRPEPAQGGKQRLHKLLAEAGVASRRDCEELIRQGRVSVNGEIQVTLPIWVDPAVDRVKVDDRPVRLARRETDKKVYIALHKPRRVISTTDDDRGRRDVTDLVHTVDNRPVRLYPVGRLDADSTGLILLTNDGELAHRLTHPRYEVPKRYHVLIRGRLTPEQADQLEAGLLLTRSKSAKGSAAPGSAKPPVKRAAIRRVSILGYHHDATHGDRTKLAVELREGQNREIRRLVARLGYKVRRLKRVGIGPLSIKGIGVGQSRSLTSAEIASLRKAAGL